MQSGRIVGVAITHKFHNADLSANLAREVDELLISLGVNSVECELVRCVSMFSFTAFC